ncbi:helix-turn-helix domain-containing protein [Cohnella suwonensis]|uniref:Helix-turn-helix domain-containing protein n=1 Tax=Cohnella suwonensis TaxID=696072 RepID=A0ABW0M5P3_9BACL
MDNGRSVDSSWILPIRISVRRWHIPLPDRDRNLLEYALCNVSDELIRHSLSGATVRVRHGTAVFLFGLSEPNPMIPGLEHRCRQLRKVAHTSLYADVEIEIGQSMSMRELPQEKMDGSFAEQRHDPVLSMKQVCYSDDTSLRRILTYIEEHLLDQLTREDIAHYVHFHPSYLSRFFRKKTGWSLSEYIVRQRIEYAKEMLEQSELRISHIMSQLGYDNLSHFTRSFKKVTGYTPLQYRKKIQ